jgi:hypothetical protein
MGFTAAGISPTTVTTTQQAPLGFELTVPDGDNGLQTWIYVFNDEASSAFEQGNVITRDGGTVTYDGILAAASSPASRVIGVAQHTIAAGSYGFILRRGIGEVKAGTGTIDINEGIVVDTTDAGTAMEFGSIAEAMDTTSTEHGISGPFGFATENAAATVLATCHINCQG